MKKLVLFMLLTAVILPTLSVYAERPIIGVATGRPEPIIGKYFPTKVNSGIVDLLLFNGKHADISIQKDTTRLMIATQKGAISEVREAITEKADVNAATETGITALMLAAKSGNLEIVKMLVSAGATIDCSSHSPEAAPPLIKGYSKHYSALKSVYFPFHTDSRQYKDKKGGFTPLVLAISSGHTPVVKFLVSKGADVNRKGYGASPLSAAIFFDHPDIAMDIATYLINQGADIKPSEQILGGTIDLLHQSLSLGYLALAERLIDMEHRDLNSTTNLIDGVPILHYSAAIGSVPAIELLIRKGAKINMADKSGLTPILHATYADKQNAVESLLNLGADINAVLTPPSDQKTFFYADYAGATPLSLSIQKQYFNIAKALIRRGSDCNVPDRKGVTPLMHVASGNNEDILKLLIERGADINAKDNRGRAPIIFAISARKINMIKLLLSKGADIHTDGVIIAALPGPTDNDEKHTLKILDLLIDKGADLNLANSKGETPLIAMLKINEVKNVQLLLSLGADPSQPDKDKVPPLHHTLRNSCYECASLLVANGADVNATDSRKRSGLLIASEKGQFEFAELFIKRGADVNASDEDGQTALTLAAEKGPFKKSHLELVKMLIENGADINAKVKFGYNAFMIASLTGNFEVADYLEANGADINAKDITGNNAYMMAALNGNKEAVDYLEAKGVDKSAWLKHVNEIEKMKQNGLIQKDASAKDFPPIMLALYKLELKKRGIWNTDSRTPDSRLSSPEKTWEFYKQALLQWDLDLAAKCLLEKKDIEVYKVLGKEKTKQIVSEMKPIEKIIGDNERVKYRINREEIIQGQTYDITYYIYFIKVYGEWRIEEQ
ncbi:MAG: ankyrin repeat domain-containing protein [Desulfobacterales bacterium]|nr:ankyrin repeat domain-containing protein [Desulfobacterales bacterium]